MKNKNCAFTLIELLIVIAIIGVLMALIAPAIANTREKSQTVACMNNIRQITQAAFMYADDNDSVIPDVRDTINYTDSAENIYKCPRDTRQGVGIAKPSYTAWKYTPATLLPADVRGVFSERILYVESDKAGVVAKDEISATDIAFRHDNRTVIVFADGHVGNYGQSQFAALEGAIKTLSIGSSKEPAE